MKKIIIDNDKFLKLYEAKQSDVAISNQLGCSAETIRTHRKSLNLLPNGGITVNGIHYKQTSIQLEVLKPLVEQGLSDYKIAKLLEYNHATVFQARKFYKLERPSLKYGQSVKPTLRQVEILIGHVLGDGHLKRHYENTAGTISQGTAQKEYAAWKVLELENLCTSLHRRVRKTIDQRTGVYYVSYDAHIKANPELNFLHELFYTGTEKVLSPEIVKYITPLSLAVWFMDDGFKSPSGFCIATNCFTEREVLIAIFRKFHITVSFQKNGVLYIPAKHKASFQQLIEPYILDSLMYKLHPGLLTPLIQGTPYSKAILSQALLGTLEKGATTSSESRTDNNSATKAGPKSTDSGRYSLNCSNN